MSSQFNSSSLSHNTSHSHNNTHNNNNNNLVRYDDEEDEMNSNSNDSKVSSKIKKLESKYQERINLLQTMYDERLQHLAKVLLLCLASLLPPPHPSHTPSALFILEQTLDKALRQTQGDEVITTMKKDSTNTAQAYAPARVLEVLQEAISAGLFYLLLLSSRFSFLVFVTLLFLLQNAKPQ
jgi:hypothetical protein